MKLLILVFLIAISLTSPAQAQQAGRIPILIFTDIKVQSQVTYNPSTGLYTYSYTVTNPSTNTGEIWDIDIDISQPLNSVNLSSDGLTIFGNITETFDKVLSAKKNPKPMIPVGIKPPPGWYGDVGEQGVASFFLGDHPSFSIYPKKTKRGFELISRGLPTVREMEMEPWWEEDIAPEITKSLIFKTKTLGPTAPPVHFNPKDFLDTIRSYVNGSVTLGWLKDPAMVTALQTEMDKTWSFIETNNSFSAKEALDRFMKHLTEASLTQRTTEAYGLLFYNAQYLKNALSVTSIEKGGKE